VRGRRRPVQNIEVTRALRILPITHYQLHQEADGSLVFRVRGRAAHEEGVRTILAELFGPDQPLRVEELPEPESPGQKVLAYTTSYRP
jgi:hypothetical protein